MISLSTDVLDWMEIQTWAAFSRRLVRPNIYVQVFRARFDVSLGQWLSKGDEFPVALLLLWKCPEYLADIVVPCLQQIVARRRARPQPSQQTRDDEQAQVWQFCAPLWT